MYSRECIERLRQLVDLREVLTSYGNVSHQDIVETSDEIRCPCPIHQGDNRSGFSWRKSTGLWKCFTKDCGNSGEHDVFGFVSLLQGVTFKQAIDLLAERYNFPLEEEDEELNIDSDSEEYTKDCIKFGSYKKKYQATNIKTLSNLPGYYKNGFPNVFKYLSCRGYKYSDIKKFNLYPFLDINNLLRVGIPVYDDIGRLVGVNARLMDNIIEYPETVINNDGVEISVSKYKMTSFKKGQILYNLNNAKGQSVQRGLVIVEGQFDVIRLYTYGIYNAVCTMGTTLTPQQVALLYKYCYHVIFLVEEGEAALSGVSKSVKALSNGMKVSIAKLSSGDADNNPREVVLDALNNMKTLNNKELGLLANGIYSI